MYSIQLECERFYRFVKLVSRSTQAWSAADRAYYVALNERSGVREACRRLEHALQRSDNLYAAFKREYSFRMFSD
jgi:hypothetical protein